MANKFSVARVEWLWKSNKDPWSKNEPEEWSRFSDVEMAIIEEAFQNKQLDVLLDNYHIDLKRLLQISNNNANHQRPIKRVDRTGSTGGGRLREARFMPNPIHPLTPFIAQKNLLVFYDEFSKHFDVYSKTFLDSPEKIADLVEKAAEGILLEAKLAGKEKEGQWIAEELLKVKYESKERIWQCCAYLYTMESFLYQKMNEYMRLAGCEQHKPLWASKIKSFGPFAYMLHVFTYSKSYEKLRLYRGANLPQDLIDQYQNSMGAYLTFPAYTSTSRNREKAEQFGNVLFVIETSSIKGIDVAPYSDYPDEEETLLKFDFAFYIRSCTFDANKKKWIIEIDDKTFPNAKD